LRCFLHVLTDRLDGLAGGFGRVFGGVPRTGGNVLDCGTCGIKRGAHVLGGTGRDVFHRSTAGVERGIHIMRRAGRDILGRSAGRIERGTDILRRACRNVRGGRTGCVERRVHVVGSTCRDVFGGIPSALGDSGSALGRGLNGFAGLFGGFLGIAPGLVTSGKAKSGRRNNEEMRFHSVVTVKNAGFGSNHIFGKISAGG